LRIGCHIASSVERVAVQAIIRRVDRWIHDLPKLRTKFRPARAKLLESRKFIIRFVKVPIAVAVKCICLLPSRR
jgi:hypothetical protein